MVLLPFLRSFLKSTGKNLYNEKRKSSKGRVTLRAVQLLVKTTIRNGKEIETIEQNVRAMLYEKGRFVYVQYEEVISEQFPPIKTTLKVAENEMKIIRHGQVKMNQTFMENEMTTGSYDAPFGQFHMTTNTTSYKQEWQENKEAGRIQLTYALQLNEQKVGVYTLDFTIREDQS